MTWYIRILTNLRQEFWDGGSTKVGYVGQNMCQIHLWCIWHRCPSIAHLVPQSGSPTLLRCQINSRNEKTLAWERERTTAIKKHLFGRVRGWCSWFDWFVYTCGSVCTAVPTLSHRESGAKIFWFDIDAYYVAYFCEIWHRPHSGRQQMPKLFTCS